jgi:hypothetical protein
VHAIHEHGLSALEKGFIEEIAVRELVIEKFGGRKWASWRGGRLLGRWEDSWLLLELVVDVFGVAIGGGKFLVSVGDIFGSEIG